MRFKWELWLYGLAAATIGGGANAVSAALAVIITDPKTFNFEGGLVKVLQVAGIAFLIGGLTAFFSYLREHPVPQWDGADRRRVAS